MTPPKAILALDLGIDMGYAYWVEGQGLAEVGQETLDFDRKNPDSRFCDFIIKTEWASRFGRSNRFNVVMVAHEAIPIYGKVQASAKPLLWSEGILHYWCMTQGLPCLGVAPTSLKKLATGKGNAKKDAVHRAAVVKWPEHEFKTNNMADAAWVAAYAAKEMGIA